MNKLIVAASAISFGMLVCVTAFALDYATATGADIVKENASKESGYSSAQLETIQEKMQGKILTFTNGRVSSVCKNGGYVDVSIVFRDPNAKGLFSSSFTVSAKVTDEAGMKIAEQFDEGLKIKSLTGRVAAKGMMQIFFELTDAKIEPAEMPNNKALFDPKTVTGADIVKGNAAKESGYSSAQLEKLQEQLQGKMLTFTNGKVSSVCKNGGYVDVSIVFRDPNAKGLFSSSFTVSAKVTDEAGMKIAEQFDEGLKIKSLTGRVAAKGMMQIFFELTDAKIDSAK